MSNDELKKLAVLLAGELKKQNGVQNTSQPEYVDANEAARILGVTPNYLRQTKDRYPHIKAGDKKQGRLMFLREALMNRFK